jgi:hypothetical protein
MNPAIYYLCPKCDLQWSSQEIPKCPACGLEEQRKLTENYYNEMRRLEDKSNASALILCQVRLVLAENQHVCGPTIEKIRGIVGDHK